ncbi:MAG: hypothetical protein D6712_04910 [Chloroflexi bacterium]|nr:MAG: hypothetical protein D6712_04910 [Chloroflexota bacterium]
MVKRLKVLSALILCILALNVIGYAQEVPFGADYYVTADVDNLQPFVGERILYTIRFYDAISPPSHVDLPDFATFWRGESTAATRAEIIHGRQYLVKEQSIALFPTRAGIQVIEPTVIDILETSLRSGAQLQTESLSINVRPLPENAPDGFSGLVGQFDVTFSLEPTTLQVGEAAIFSVSLLGSGNLAQAKPAAPALPEDMWRVIERPASDIQRNGPLQSRQYRWMIIPLRAGEHVLPAPTVVYFEPQTESYRIVPGEPQRIVVRAADDGTVVLSAEAVNIEAAAEGAAFTPVLKPIDNIQFGGVNSGGRFWLWLLPPIITGGALIWRYQQRKEAQRKQQQAAWYAARKALAQAKKKRAYHYVRQAIYRYIEIKAQGVKPLTREELISIVCEHGDNRLAEALNICLQQADMGDFSPKTLNKDAPLQPLIEQTRKTLQALEQTWHD